MITGLPEGMEYTVTEVEANQFGYTTTSTGTQGTLSATAGASADFIIDKTEEIPEPTPTTGNLTV